MSEHSNAASKAATAVPEDLPAESATGSLKKQNNTDADIPITDDFVLMTTPEKFKDKNVNETSAVKRHCTESSPNEKVNLDCLLLSDTSEEYGAPQHVLTLFKHFESMQLSQAEILFLLIYIVALESGFMDQSDYEEAKPSLVILPTIYSFHARNILRLSHLRPNYKSIAEKTRFTLKLRSIVDLQNESSDYVYALLTGFVTGDFLIVTLTPAPSTGAKGFSTTLSIGRYVLSMQATNKPFYFRFRKLNELSYILRDQLFAPMRHQHIGWLDCCINASLDGMPLELYDRILNNLNANQVKTLANVNKSMYNVTKHFKSMLQTKKSLTKIYI